MEIIIDTNIVYSDWMFRNADSTAFLEYVRRTNARIYVPQIVWDEVLNNYVNALKTKHKNYEDNSKLFGSILVDTPVLKIVNLDYDAEGQRYLTWLQRQFGYDNFKVISHGEFTARLAKRSMAKRRPFNGTSEREFKDSLVWETVLDFMSGVLGANDTELVFISNDSKAFGLDKKNTQSTKSISLDATRNDLHEHLIEDLMEYNVLDKKFSFYSTLGGFVSEHYAPIKGISPEGLIIFLKEKNEFRNLFYLIFKEKIKEINEAIAFANPRYIIGEVSIESDLLFSEIQQFFLFKNSNDIISVSGILFVAVGVGILYKTDIGAKSYLSNNNLIFEVKVLADYALGFNNLVIESMVVAPESKLEFNGSYVEKRKFVSSADSVVWKIIDNFYDSNINDIFKIEMLDFEKSIKNTKSIDLGVSKGNSKYIPNANASLLKIKKHKNKKR
ncbi:PIN domain-containing protein [Hymenobacter yonginensis]|uniref:PIN domain-containing protein n=1 Tax=Hymenobacter yonginensis TaxID=748197 RepID=A0ABY7PUJ9_9BACT|nr:PIN domain-containing protein [Hymenobacter yonginensis]WBO86544.1 PIN domain-containing protein [Hymenobacter yonginensis]